MTGRHPSRIFNLCSAMCRETPVISAGFQANMSRLRLSRPHSCFRPSSVKNLLTFLFSIGVVIGGGGLKFPLSKSKISFGVFVRRVNLSCFHSGFCWFWKPPFLKFGFFSTSCSFHDGNDLFRSRLEASTSPLKNVVVTLIIPSTDFEILSCNRLISSGLVIVNINRFFRKVVEPHSCVSRIDHTKVATEILKAATEVLAQGKRSSLPKNVITKVQPHEGRKRCRKAKVVQEDIGSQGRRGSAGGHWKSKPKSQKSSVEDDLSQPWRDGESAEEFMRRYKLECRDVKGASECMKISRFMYEITNPELIKRLHDKILKSVDEMMGVTIAFLRGEVAASNHERKKSFPSWKHQEAGQKQNF
nr:reverse transcriptase domain-containing protein [Tanacetum cinerariifolium]